MITFSAHSPGTSLLRRTRVVITVQSPRFHAAMLVDNGRKQCARRYIATRAGNRQRRVCARVREPAASSTIGDAPVGVELGSVARYRCCRTRRQNMLALLA